MGRSPAPYSVRKGKKIIMKDLIDVANEYEDSDGYKSLQKRTRAMNAKLAYHNSSKHVNEMIKDLQIYHRINDTLNGYWPPIAPYADYPELPMTNLSGFPDDLLNFSSWVASELSMMTEEVCLGILGIVSIASRGRYVLELTPTWKEAGPLHIVMAKDSGSKKSALFDILTSPLRKYEQEQRNISSKPNPEISKLVLQENDKLARSEIKAILQKPDGRTQLDAYIQQAGEKRQKLTNDFGEQSPLTVLTTHCTIPALEQEMSRQGGVAGICATEDVFNRLRLYDKTASAELLLQSYDMDNYSRSITNRPSINLSKPTIAMLIGMQPEILLSYYDKKHLRENGFLNRLTPCFMSSLTDYGNIRQWNQKEVDKLQENYDRKIGAIIRACFTQSPTREIYPLKVSPSAYDLVKNYEKELVCYPTDSPFHGFLKKHPGRVVRLAGCLHILRHEDPTRHAIDEYDMTLAINFGRGIQAHAKYAFDGDNRKIRNDAHRILSFIDHNRYLVFDVTDISQNLYKMNKGKVLNAVEYLESNGYVKRIAVHERTTVYVVNPYVFNSYSW